MRLHRRLLFLVPEPGPSDCYGYGYGYGHGCTPPPPSIPSSPDPGPSPSLAPSFPPLPRFPPCSPFLFPPAPSPAHSGRRNQGGGGMQGYGPPPGVGGAAGDDHPRYYVRYVLIAAAVIAFVSLILLGVSVAVRRRQLRRRRQALLAQAAAPAGADDGGGDDPEGGGGGGGGVVHHVWYIRTVGLEEAEINSIAVTQYRGGAGLLGAADCSVCLGEFQDGELVRLLPKCGHAFHVPCIDTWLRAHVNCPLCRSHVLDPAVTAAAGDGAGGEASSDPPADPDANANAEAEQAAEASDAIPEHDQGDSDQQGEEAALPAQEGQDEQYPEPPPPPQLFCTLPRNVRRAASMDAAIVSTAADVTVALEHLPEAAPEEEQIGGGRRKRWMVKASSSGHRSNLSTDRPASVGVPRSFFSRHSRARSSVLPL